MKPGVPREIERKFLTSSEAWRDRVTGKVELRDGLVAVSDGRKVRIRLYDNRATIAVKGDRRGILRAEFEYPIPFADALEMLEHHCEDRICEKTRYYVQEGGVVFELDVYHGILEGVVIAEIELADVDDDFPRPEWLGQEITGLEQYRKINMLQDRQASVGDRVAAAPIPAPVDDI